MGDIVPIQPDEGSRVSGGELPHGSDQVWALRLFSGRKAHFWERDIMGYTRICDRDFTPAFLPNGQSPLFDPGNFQKCKRCMKKLIAPNANASR